MTVEEADVVVVGGGPAGMSAALWLARYRRRVVLLDAEQPRNGPTEKAHGYLGLDPVAPAELRARGRRELEAYKTVRLLCLPVEAAEAQADGFTVRTAGQRFGARRLVLATGTSDVLPDIEGFGRHYGAQVFHCPTCDGYEARGARVAVIGWGYQITGFALGLLDWARDVVVVTDGHRLRAAPDERSHLDEAGIRVVEGEARRMVGERGALEGIDLHDGVCVSCDMAFFSIEHRPNTTLARQLGCQLDGDGYVAVDREQQTTVRGVYAVGDVTPGMQLVAVAVGQGAVAGSACAESLR